MFLCLTIKHSQKRHVQELGLVPLYITDDDVKLFCGMRDALTDPLNPLSGIVNVNEATLVHREQTTSVSMVRAVTTRSHSW